MEAQGAGHYHHCMDREPAERIRRFEAFDEIAGPASGSGQRLTPL
jgi:hypothetical protein